MQSLKAKAFSLLAKRSYFSKELRQKLLEKEYPKTEIEKLLSELTDQGWLNDLELAERFVKLQREKGYGARLIVQKLRQKAGDLPIDVEEGDIEELVKRKYLRKLPEQRDKVIAALLRRGFSYDLINKTLESIRK